VIGTYQHPTLVEPMRKVMALWDQPQSEELPIDALTQATAGSLTGSRPDAGL
jgi:hypothetical protein